MTFRVKKTANFCQISNAVLRDTRLSYCARGILAMVMTHSDSWNTSTKWLRDNTKSEGKTAIANAIRELKECGYLVITPHSKAGRLCGYVWTWSDAPQTQEDEQDVRKEGSCSEDALRAASKEHHSSEDHTEEYVSDDYASEPDPEDLLPKEQQLPIEAIPTSARPPSAPLVAASTKPKAPRPRDLIGEAMLEVCWGITDYTKATKHQWSFVSRAIKELKAVQPDLNPRMIREFASKKRKEWEGLPFSPGAITKHWQPVSSSAQASQEPDPFDNKPTVTRGEINAKFGYGAESVKWLNRLHAAGRLVK